MTRFLTTKQWTKSKKRLPKSVLVIHKKKASKKVRVVKKVGR